MKRQMRTLYLQLFESDNSDRIHEMLLFDLVCLQFQTFVFRFSAYCAFHSVLFGFV